MTTSISIALKNQGIDKLTKLEEMFSCHNREKKRREYAKLKENKKPLKIRFFLQTIRSGSIICKLSLVVLDK